MENNRPRPKKRVTRKQLRNRRIGGLIVLLLIIFLLSKGCASCVRCACKSGGKTTTDDNAVTTTDVSSEGTETVPAFTEPTLPQESLVETMPPSHKIEVTPIYKDPELPTGSEVTSLAMLLNHLGFEIDKETLAKNYLICADRGEATFSQAFIGSPFDDNGMGCFAPVIVDTAMKYLNSQSSTRTVKALNADTFDDVLLRVASDQPVLVWINTNLELMQEEYCFTVYGTNGIYTTAPPVETSVVVLGTTAPSEAEDVTETPTTASPSDDFKQDVYWIPNATCVLLTGYDTINDTVTVIDPAQGEITYNMGMFKTSYNALYKQAVVIY